MLSALLSRIENTKWPLLGPNIWVLEKWSMWQTRQGFKRVYDNIIQLAIACFIITMYVEFWTVRSNASLALRNLSFSILGSTCFAKALTFILWQDGWRKIVLYVTDLEAKQRFEQDVEVNAIIDEYTKYAKDLDKFYAFLAGSTVVNAVLMPLSIHLFTDNPDFVLEVMSSWSPLDKTQGFGLWIHFIVQTSAYIWGGGVVWGYDTLSFTLMSFIEGQLRILKLNCERIFGDDTVVVGDDEALERLKACHISYIELVRHTTIMNSHLSPVMFFYVIVCSLMICASAFRITKDENVGYLELIFIVEYLIALIFQLFLYSWHATKIHYMSETIHYSAFSSQWYNRSAGIKKSTLLLLSHLNVKPIVFTAGPFTQLNLDTFVQILRASYSYYTLLK